jgi:hypothetical protein
VYTKHFADLLKAENFIIALATGHVDGCCRFFEFKKVTNKPKFPKIGGLKKVV